jgi:hypothetical protein
LIYNGSIELKIFTIEEAMDQKKVGKCGLYCGACPFYLATASPEVKEYLTEKWGKWEEAWYCKGCGDLDEKSWCFGCKMLSCLEEKGLTHCSECVEEHCEEVEEFDNDDCLHHKTARSNRERVKNMGCQAWLEEEIKHWTCSNCGSPFMWYSENCYKCGNKVEGLKK